MCEGFHGRGWVHVHTFPHDFKGQKDLGKAKVPISGQSVSRGNVADF